MNVKYLSDGRKVAVVGKLNNEETIVQEIFIAENGTEIASGENFVTKSLHDTPVMSWKDKSAAKLENKIQELEEKKKNAQREYKESWDKLKAIKDVLKSSRNLCSSLEENEAERLASFLTGTIQYLVVYHYEIRKPEKLIDSIISWDYNYGREKRYDSIKLLSVLGRSDGDLEYRINQYRDGSGGSTTVYPCCSIEEATEKIKNIAIDKIERGFLTKKEFNVCKELGIVFSDEQLDKLREDINSKTNKAIARLEAETLRKNQEIKDLKNSLDSDI